MAATISALDKILKEFYLPPVVEQLNNKVLLAKRLDTDNNSLYGRRAIVPVHKGRSGGIGARGELENLPTPDSQKYEDAIYTLKYLYAAVQASGPAMELTSSNEGAFLEAFKSELDGIRNDVMRDFARQTYGPGTAAIAQCGTTTASTSMVLASDEALRKGYLYPGLPVDVGTQAAPTGRTSANVIVSVDIPSKTVVLTSAVTTAGTDFVFISGANVGGAVREMSGGLQALISTTPTTGTYGGLDVSQAANAFWRNLQFGATAGAITLDDLQQCDGLVDLAGGETSAVITSRGVMRKYYNLLQSQVRYTDPMKLEGGFRTLDFNDRPFIADRDAPYGNVYFLDEKYIKMFSNRDWHFLDRDGEQIKWVQNKDGWQAFLCRYVEMGAVRRNVQLVYSGVTDATGV